MSSRLKKIFKFLLNVESKQLLKVTYLAIIFFLIIGAYTISKELKDVVFTAIIGQDRKYFFYAKVLSMLFLVPVIFLHSRIVDYLNRYQILALYTFLFGLLGILFSYFFSIKSIGLVNQISSPYRLFGWFFYFFAELYSPLLVGIFWAFANSITDPKDIKDNYTLIITGSKIGGIFISCFALFILSEKFFSDIFNLQLLLFISSIFLLFVPIVIYLLVKSVSAQELHGYEAAYIIDKEVKIKEQKEPWYVSIFSGLVLLFKYPYVMGIFGMSFFFEMVNQLIKVENIIFGKNLSQSLSGFAGFLIWQAFLVHLVGLIVVFLGTRAIIDFLGKVVALMLVPILTGIAIILFLVKPTYFTAIIAFVITRSVNYALAVPLRESLYIPTISEIKFKTKSWIDGIGTKFAKMSALSFNLLSNGFVSSNILNMHNIFFILIISFWTVMAYLLGKKFENIVNNNKVIGAEELS